MIELNTLLLILIIVILIIAIYKLKTLSLSGVEERLTLLNHLLDRLDKNSRDESQRLRDELLNISKLLREEVSRAMNLIGDVIVKNMAEHSRLQKSQLDIFSERLNKLADVTEERLGRMRETVEERLAHLQSENAKKLDEMRALVDEKLHETLEKRLGDSFKIVSERLEQVHQGLGEMKILASNVGDLKKVLTNIKTRGVWGEIQLGVLLEQILTPDQYATNVITKKGSNEKVEFAIRLPGNRDGGEVFLPIDAKFPLESYQRLLDAYDRGEQEKIKEQLTLLERHIKDEAKKIRDKYIDPPNTTDFAIMFLPVEGLFAEVMRIPGLCEGIQRDFRVVITGPTTLTALLNSLQIGFRTLAIEKRTSEVWQLLGAVKTEFQKFGELLEKTGERLRQATKTIEEATKKTKAIEKRLIDVEALPHERAECLLEDGKE